MTDGTRRVFSILTRCALVAGIFLLGGCRTEQNAGNVTKGTDSHSTPALPGPGPAPGSAEVRGVVSGCEPVDGGFQCRLVVREILRYGAATPVLTVAREMTVAYSPAQGTPSWPDLLNPGKVIRFVLSHTHRMDGDARPAWRIVRVSSE